MGVESVVNIQVKSRLNIAHLKTFAYQIKKKLQCSKTLEHGLVICPRATHRHIPGKIKLYS